MILLTLFNPQPSNPSTLRAPSTLQSLNLSILQSFNLQSLNPSPPHPFTTTTGTTFSQFLAGDADLGQGFPEGFFAFGEADKVGLVVTCEIINSRGDGFV
ncbi:MAG: hypothetical protein R2769_05840 [Saprospiraceae bacterium]